MTIDQRSFRHALSHFASGVTVVTTREGQHLAGITVSSFASLSLDPPLVLICIDHKVRSHDTIARAGAFVVNILSSDQEDVARRFASRDVEKFLPGTYALSAQGMPLLADVLTTLECRIANTLPGGDHTIFVGEVRAIATNEGEPLLYYRSQFGQFVPELQPHVVETQLSVGAM